MSELNLSDCLYDISKVPDKERVVDYYPELRSYEEFNSVPDKVVRICILISDLSSPFLKERTFSKRVENVFEYLKINKKTEEDKLLYDSIIATSNTDLFLVCATYLQLQNNHDFTYWWNLNRMFYELMAEMGTPRPAKESTSNYVKTRVQLGKEAESIKDKLVSIEIVLFSDDKTKMAVSKALSKRMRTYAERNAIEDSIE